MFEELVGLIDKIKDDSIGEWIVDKENDGTLEHPMQMRGTHPHWSKGAYTTDHEKPSKHHGEPRRPHCKGT